VIPDNHKEKAMATRAFTQPLPLAAPRTLRPRAPRTLTLLLIGRIVGERGDALCRVRNISAGGLMAEAYASFAVGEKLRVEFRNDLALSGSVRWTRDGMLGLEFDEPAADIKQLLSERSPGQRGPGARQPRALRFAADCQADLKLEGHYYRGAVTDLSLTGARIVTRAPLERDRMLVFAMTGIAQRRAVVRWKGEDGGGIVFLEPLAFGTLAPWLNDASLRYDRRELPSP
jgi:hypothetical protein